MIFHSPIMALLLASAVSTAIVLWGAMFGLKVLRHWNVESGHARQIAMEKQTYLVSTALAFVMVLELVSLLLFVFNADRMSVLFVGAMCAVGTLNVNDFGFPALLTKMAVFFGAAVWLVVNHADGLGRDYPLTRFKYGFLVGLAPVVLAAGVLQLLYFLNLDANVITSCCSKLFTPETTGLEAELSSADPAFALYGLYGGLAVVSAMALWALKSGRVAAVYGLAGAAFFVVAIIAIVSVISAYIYEHPHHHCPFCILKPEYGYIGYALYLPLFAGTAIALSAALLSVYPLPDSLRERLPAMLRHTVIVSACLFILFGLVATYAIMRSNLILFS